ncbi:DUF1403 family protein [Rhizobium sp. LjRoot30]|uniref:DUF1403 family protein n=1 Tax=Rhizobium sp. LjRoot30 TaxID=3342320 RepID=UPI003ECF30A4
MPILRAMDSLKLPPSDPRPRARTLPAWASAKTEATGEADAAFAAGAALHSLDTLVKSEPVWAGCWRGRLVMKSALSAVRLLRRGEDEAALRDAIHLCAPGSDPGPAGRIFLAYAKLRDRRTAIDPALVQELADLLSVPCGDEAEAIAKLAADAARSTRAAPFAAADLITSVWTAYPDAEVLGWWLADWLLAAKLGWSRPVCLLLPERFGASFRTTTGRGRLRPGEDGFSRALCLALVQATADALRLANDIERRAEALLAVAPKVRTKGAGVVIRQILDEDAVFVSAPGANLSRWASRRFFERLESLGGVRELSGRAGFRIYGL